MRNAFIRRVLFSHNTLKQYQNKVGILRDIIIHVPTYIVHIFRVLFILL